MENGGWVPIAPSSLQFASNYHVPKEMSTQEIKLVVEQFVKAAKRSVEAGFRVIELHAAHGYLRHEFLSPLTNRMQQHRRCFYCYKRSISSRQKQWNDYYNPFQQRECQCCYCYVKWRHAFLKIDFDLGKS